MPTWRIERLSDTKVDRRSFNSGDAELDRFLHQFASQYEKRNVGRTFIAMPTGADVVAGYYTLANSSVSFEAVPIKLPRHPIPTLLLARLAVDVSQRGQRLGEFLLFDALRRSLDIAKNAALFAVEVDAYQTAIPFYTKYGFQPFLDNAQHLFLPIKHVEQMGL
jgi:predicted GNAT family N-acyltransferase